MEYVLFNKYNIIITKEDHSNYVYFSDEENYCYETIDITDTDNINEFLEYLNNYYCVDLSDEISQIINNIISIDDIE